MDTDLPVTPSFQEFLAAGQLSPEVRLHVDVDIVTPLWKFPGEALPQGVLHWVHLHSRGAGLGVGRDCLRDGRHPRVSLLSHA